MDKYKKSGARNEELREDKKKGGHWKYIRAAWPPCFVVE
jgi:hypothetical protein